MADKALGEMRGLRDRMQREAGRKWAVHTPGELLVYVCGRVLRGSGLGSSCESSRGSGDSATRRGVNAEPGRKGWRLWCTGGFEELGVEEKQKMGC